MKTKQRHIAQLLNISESYLSLILSGKKPVSWFLAEKFSNIFPNKTISQWRYSKPADILKAFHALNNTNPKTKKRGQNA